MKTIKLKLCNGVFNIKKANEFRIESKERPIMQYEENDIWYVVCNSNNGCLYNTVIYIKDNVQVENIEIEANNCAVNCCDINGGTICIKIKKSSVSFDMITARRIIIDFSNGNAEMLINPIVALDVDCGRGNMNLKLKKNNRGYFYNIVRGGGIVDINHESIPKKYVFGKRSGIKTDIKCGIGKISILEV